MSGLADIIKVLKFASTGRFGSQIGADSGGFFAGPEGLGGIGNATPGQGIAQLLQLFKLLQGGGSSN